METETNKQQNEPQSQNPFVVFGLFLWDLVKVFLIAIIIIIPFRLYIAEPFMVSGSSMVPNFHDKDYLIIDRISYRLKAPQRGEVVVLKFPKDTTQYYIKRIVGLPGETIKCETGSVVVTENGGENVILKEIYLADTVKTNNCRPIQKLGSEEYFVMGDNRTGSSDSRAWGVLPKKDIVGKVWLRVFPFKNFGFFHDPAYTF
jgi:signal peptidase I